MTFLSKNIFQVKTQKPNNILIMTFLSKDIFQVRTQNQMTFLSKHIFQVKTQKPNDISQQRHFPGKGTKT